MKLIILFSCLAVICCKDLFKEKLPNDEKDFQNLKFIVLKEVDNKTYVDISNYKISNNLIEYKNLNTGFNMTTSEFIYLYKFCAASSINSQIFLINEHENEEYKIMAFRDSTSFTLSILKTSNDKKYIRAIHLNNPKYMPLLQIPNRISNL